MRLLHVNFDKYGPFTDKQLLFNPGAKLHLIYGRNASGKSCALAGITDLLFGIESQTRFDFLHDRKQLSISATLCDRDGSELAFRRRKGTKGVLSTPGGAPLPDGAIAAKLGGLTRGVFTHAFGLNSDQLREGAQEMLDSEGEVGVSMYAAASGLAGIARLRRTLEDEAGVIFKGGRGSDKRRFDKAASAYTIARQEMVQRTVRAEKLRAQREEAGRARRDLQNVRQARTVARAEHSKLTRLLTLAPALDHLDRERAVLQGFDGVPNIKEDTLKELRESQERAAAAVAEFRDAERELERARLAINSAPAVPEWVQLQASVRTLQTNLGRYREDTKDKARVAGELESTRREIIEDGRRIGLNEEEMDSAQPTDAAMATLASLIAEGEELQRKRETREAAIAELRRDIDKLLPGDEESPTPDPSSWQISLAALQKRRPLLEQQLQLQKGIERKRRRFEEKRARLRPQAPSLERLATCSLPEEAVVTAVTASLGAAKLTWDKCGEKLEQARADLKRHRRDLQMLLGGAQVASAESISAAREARDATWHSLRAVLLDQEGARGPALLPSAELHEARVAQADSLADSAAQDAAKVARHQALQLSIQAANEAIQAAEQERVAAEEVVTVTRATWVQLWSAVTSEPGAPAEMLSWATELGVVLRDREELLTDVQELASLDAPLKEVRVGLLMLREQIGGAAGSDLAPEGLFSLIEEELRVRNESWSRESSRRTLRSGKENDLKRRIREQTQDEGDAIGFSERWQKGCRQAGVDAHETLAGATAALQVWRALPAKKRALDKDKKRVAGMERNIESFEQEVARLSSEICPASPPLSCLDQAQRLSDAMDGAVEKKSLQTGASNRVRAAEEAVLQKDLTVQQNAHEFAELLEAYGQPGGSGEAIERLEQALAARSRVADAERSFAAVSEAGSEETWKAALTGFDPDRARVTIADYESAFATQDAAVDAAVTGSERAENALKELETGSGAEGALHAMKASELEMEEAARDYLRLKLGAVMLDRMIEQHRTRQSDPLMHAASVFFHSLTDGAFAGISQEFDDDQPEQAQLVGVRASGGTVCVDGLSEGQRDQLYLALRLAFLDDYAQKSEPVPFVGDDLFMTFDDESTRAGLLALAALSARVQPILFTHHRSVVDAAKAALGGELDLLEL